MKFAYSFWVFLFLNSFANAIGAVFVLNEEFPVMQGSVNDLIEVEEYETGEIPLSGGPIILRTGDVVDFTFRFKKGEALVLNSGDAGPNDHELFLFGRNAAGLPGPTSVTNAKVELLGLSGDGIPNMKTFSSVSFLGDTGFDTRLGLFHTFFVDRDAPINQVYSFEGIRIELSVSEFPSEPVVFDRFSFYSRPGVSGTVMTVVPEPSMSLLFLASALVFLRKRRVGGIR